jgi:hypothetical protein
VSLEDRCDLGAVGRPGSRRRPELFEEPVPAAGREDHDEFAGSVCQVEEGVSHFRRQVGEPAHVELEDLLADPDPEPPLQDVDRLLLLVVDVERGSAFGRDFDGEVVEGAICVIAGELENQVSPWAGLQPQAIVGSENRLADVDLHASVPLGSFCR